jgi:small-conductance mechanosensitive channel
MPTALFALAGYSESWIAAPVLLLCGLGVLGFIYSPAMRTDKTPSQKLRRFLIGLGVALEIVCAVPVLFSSNAYGVIVLLLLLSLGIICILIGAFIPQSSTEPSHTNQKVEKSPAHKLLWLITVIFYLLLSFLTQAWFITWILFLIAACISILLDAIQEKRE